MAELKPGQGDLKTGLYFEESGYGKPTDITWALSRQASQENCDGDPYDAMVFAASYIDKLRKDITGLSLALVAKNSQVLESMLGSEEKPQ